MTARNLRFSTESSEEQYERILEKPAQRKTRNLSSTYAVPENDGRHVQHEEDAQGIHGPTADIRIDRVTENSDRHTSARIVKPRIGVENSLKRSGDSCPPAHQHRLPLRRLGSYHNSFSFRHPNSSLQGSSHSHNAPDAGSPPPSCTTEMQISEVFSDEHVSKCIYEWLDSFQRYDISCYRTAVTTPPVTEASLRELSLKSISYNPRLRHDVNFNRELHFRPNLEGNKGERKKQEQSDYWAALCMELEVYRLLSLPENIAHFAALGITEGRVMKVAQRRVREMFKHIREILITLVPKRDHPVIREHLDVDMLMQKIERGICDFVSIARWLAALIKTHCAPMRDAFVDLMVRRFKEGNRLGRVREIAHGLRQLFGVLEMMKLDVANHQIRNLRPDFIKDTVAFEQKEVKSHDAESLHLAQNWYRQHLPHVHDHKVVGLIDAVLNSLVSSHRVIHWHTTFNLDRERLQSLRLELRQLIPQASVFGIFVRLLAHKCGFARPSIQALQALQKDLVAITSESDGTHSNPPSGIDAWFSNLENIAIELVRHTLRFCGSKNNYDPEIFELALDELQRSLCTPESEMWGCQSSIFKAELLSSVVPLVKQGLGKSPLELHYEFVCNPLPTISALPAQKWSFNVASQAPVTGAKDVDAWIAAGRQAQLASITRRLSHILTLHWQVWGDMLYFPPDTAEKEAHPAGNGSSISSLSVSRSSSPGGFVQTQGAGGFDSASAGAERSSILGISDEAMMAVAEPISSETQRPASAEDGRGMAFR